MMMMMMMRIMKGRKSRERKSGTWRRRLSRMKIIVKRRRV